MPTYQFKCPDCEHVFEEFRWLNRFDDPAYCPRCGIHARRKYSLAGHFNGFAGFKEDYYQAFEKHIGSGREFRDEIKRCEEEHYNDTGVEIKIGHKR
jgi:putative FmdB family regulatory protein